MTAAEKLKEMGREEGLEKGRAEGLEKGRSQKQSEMTVKALKQGLDPRMIAHISELDLETVLKLKAGT